MRKVIAAVYLTLDGVMENPTWTGPYFNDELARAQHALLFASEALLLGRVTYEGFAAAWPDVTDEQGFADRMNTMPKFVASRTLAAATWHATLLAGDAPAAVAALRQQPGQNLLLYGSGQLADTLRQHNLIDEYRLMVFPVVRGRGQRFFREGSAPTDFVLTDSQRTSTGVSLLTYHPAA
ncbi:dihydrofolate reductase family protein [Hymenobacter cheonanensis]|uniref:dihydrofolate reductase family protein n=1 Tax=Hymenobacter sp. CA2-7 TaxID=3063993 RepID=UPI00271436D1|nr:dihydrofolate reductase family protein [Hymenobacter sp. CA2-7]MDO7886338.1 dihydrofolate reductase family protein [Hymenobacter sp. CA2-7]